MNLPPAQSGVQSLICSTAVPNPAAEPQLTQCRSARTSPASAQVRMNDEGRVCGLSRQLTTTGVALAGGASLRNRAVAAARAGADAQPVAARVSTVRISTAARFMAGSLECLRYIFRRGE